MYSLAAMLSFGLGSANAQGKNIPKRDAPLMMYSSVYFGTASHFRDTALEHYIHDELPEIIAQEEQIFRIKDNSTPRVDAYFDSCSSEYGKYTFKDEKTYINEAECSLLNILEVIAHEKGHYYTNLLAKAIGVNLRETYTSDNIITAMGTKMVFEGIAEYCEKKICLEEENDFEWPKDPITNYVKSELGMSEAKDSTRDYIYDGGYFVVKPVIEMYGVIGIEYMLQHPPTSYDELQKPAEFYDQRILQDLKYLENKNN